MNLNATKNTIMSALNPKKAGVIFKKIITRFVNDNGTLSSAANNAWLRAKATTDAEWLKEQDPELWALAEEKFQDYMKTDVERIRGNYPEEINGPSGAYAMLYFLVRKHQPEVVVETGVSLGCSSHAILTAMEDNGKGELHSSDFPYFRVKDAEKYIGFVVPESLRGRWNLYLDGDAANLPKIYDKIDKVDMFHYDSDKSVGGRNMAYDISLPKMAEGGMMFFDDAHDNSHFHDLVQAKNLKDRIRVVDYKKKYIGIIEKF